MRAEKPVGDLWWKHTVIYCLDVEMFLDANGDGIGDFEGLCERVDYLAGLGIDCIWLMPFYPTPNRDDGYDIIDYYGVDPRVGDIAGFTEFMRLANSHGIKVIIDLVVNHSSVEHPWFQSARSSPDSPFRNYYVWRDEPPPDYEPSLVFPGEQTTNWTYDERAGQYYFHHFYSHQPDLNPDEQAVRNEMHQIMAYWLQQGVAGFRIDAVPFLIQLGQPGGDGELAPHDFLKDLSAFAHRRKGDAVLVGEVNLPPVDQLRYFGEGDELQLIFNFHVNQYLYLALAREDPDPLRKAVLALPRIPDYCQWANFIKNHDEQTLDQLTVAERNEVFEAFGSKPSMRLYGRGIRRRLPGMLDGDEARIRLAYSLMFSLPGVPVLFYGEEIGMFENLRVPGRAAVRTPMQWQAGRKAGFSTAPLKALRRSPTAGDSGADAINVADQRRDAGSMLNWMERLIRRRNEVAEFGFGKPEVHDVGNDAVFAHSCDWEGRVVVALHNFSAQPCKVSIEDLVGRSAQDVIELWGDRVYTTEAVDPASVELDGYGYRWLRIRSQGQELLL